MTKDYKSFSSIAKPRFREMAKALGYEQLSGVAYIKSRGDWYESFALQASTYGNDFFYINYGVIVPGHWPPFDKPIDFKCLPYVLHGRLHNDYSHTFSNATKDEVAKSAAIALERYKEQAVPWFEEILGLKHIAEIYFKSHKLDKNKLGKYEYGIQLMLANYALLLRLAGEIEEALLWLQEAERLMALPVYFTRDGRCVHEREKYARIAKPEAYEVEQHEQIKAVIQEMQSSVKSHK